MNGSNGINRKAAVISAVSAVLVIGLVVGLVFLLAGDKKDNGAAQATAPGVPAGGIVSAASTGTAGASGSSSHTGSSTSGSPTVAPGSSPASPGTSPSSAPTLSAAPMPIWLTTLSGSSSDSATGDWLRS
jgi:hypothetical protein